MTATVNRIPTIKLWNLMLVPLQGDVDDRQGEVLCDDVLQGIQREEMVGLIIDVTGLWLMDSHLCSVLSTLASSAALMGTRTVLCGLSPEIAITLQTMGLDMPDVATVPSLEDALELLGIGRVYDSHRIEDLGAGGAWASDSPAEQFTTVDDQQGEDEQWTTETPLKPRSSIGS